MTVSTEHMGQFLLGRNIGLFGADAILNDMTLPGVGAGGGQLRDAGQHLARIDWLSATSTRTGSAQIDYTTRDFGGFKVTLGIFDPLEPLGQALATRHHGAAGKRARLSRQGRLRQQGATFISPRA
jgi:hypothetical protein